MDRAVSTTVAVVVVLVIAFMVFLVGVFRGMHPSRGSLRTLERGSEASVRHKRDPPVAIPVKDDPPPIHQELDVFALIQAAGKEGVRVTFEP